MDKWDGWIRSLLILPLRQHPRFANPSAWRRLVSSPHPTSLPAGGSRAHPGPAGHAASRKRASKAKPQRRRSSENAAHAQHGRCNAANAHRQHSASARSARRQRGRSMTQNAGRIGLKRSLESALPGGLENAVSLTVESACAWARKQNETPVSLRVESACADAVRGKGICASLRCLKAALRGGNPQCEMPPNPAVSRWEPRPVSFDRKRPLALDCS